MAKHSTFKSTRSGKAQTMARRAKRAVKYATREIDLSTLDLSRGVTA